MIGQIIKKLREENKMTQQELANKLKVSASTIGMYELNNRQPSIEMITTLANFFNVTTDYLLGKEDKELDDVSFAFSGREGLNEEDIEDVKRYIEFIKEKKKKK